MYRRTLNICPQVFSSLTSSGFSCPANLVIPLTIKLVKCCFMATYVIKIARLVNHAKTTAALIGERLNP